MGYRTKKRLVGEIAKARERWLRDRDLALETLKESSPVFGLAGMKLVTEIFLGELDRAVSNAGNVLTRYTVPGSTARNEACDALHGAIDMYFGGLQQPLLTSDPAIEQALRRAHEHVRVLAGAATPLSELSLLTRLLAAAMRLMKSSRHSDANAS